MFTIIHSSGLYFHNKGRIILFESEQEAQNFINMFIQYSMNQMNQEGRIDEIMRVPIVAMHECQIIPVNFNIEEVKCGIVLAKELFENVR